MPASDPSSAPRPYGRQFVRILRVIALASIASAAAAVVLAATGSSDTRLPMLIATALGLGFCVLLGIATATLLFLSKRLGQHEAAADRQQKDDNDSRI